MEASAAKTAKGASVMMNPVIFSITSDSWSIQSINASARLPRLDAATPNNSENTTICRISLPAIACTIDVGMMWSRMSFNCGVTAAGTAAAAAPAAGEGGGRPTPGSNSCTRITPIVIDTIDAKMNQPMVLAPTRAIEAVSSMRATPTVSVENTKGAMTILIRCRKAVVTSDRLAATASVRAPGPS